MTVDYLRRPSEMLRLVTFMYLVKIWKKKRQRGNCLLRSSEKRDIIVLFFLVLPWHKLDASLRFPIIHRCSNNPLKFRHILYNSNNRMKTRSNWKEGEQYKPLAQFIASSQFLLWDALGRTNKLLWLGSVLLSLEGLQVTRPLTIKHCLFHLGSALWHE